MACWKTKILRQMGFLSREVRKHGLVNKGIKVPIRDERHENQRSQ